MKFTSSVLSENFSIPTKHEVEDKSYFQGLLEFNNDIHKLDVSVACDSYKELTNAILDSSYNTDKIEGSYKSRFITVLDLINKLIETFTTNQVRNISTIKALSEKLSALLNEYEIPLTGSGDKGIYNLSLCNFSKPSSNIEVICDTTIEKFIAKIISISDANRFDANAHVDDADRIFVEGLQNVAKQILTGLSSNEVGSINSAKKMLDIIKSTHNVSYKEGLTGSDVKLAVRNVIDSSIHDIYRIRKNDALIDSCKDIIKNSKDFDKKELATDRYRLMDMVVGRLIEFLRAFTYALESQYHYNIYALKILINFFERNFVAKESGFIHGEEFNSDTLFGNEDLRDFNRTEWLDLSLTTECFEAIKEIDESRRRMMLREAIVLTDDEPYKISRLIAMREAEENRVGDNIKAIFETIKKTIQKFFNDITDKCADLSKRIQDNSNIMNNKITLGKISSKGDIIAGMYRVQQPISIIPFDLESMRDDLKDKKTFFEKRVLSSLQQTSANSRRTVKWDSNMNITDYCKAYFGASFPEDKYPKCEYTGADFESLKKDMIGFVNKATNIKNRINSDITKLEAESKKFSNVAVTPQTDNKQSNDNKPAQDNNKNVSPQNASYLSSMYNSWINEADIETGVSNNTDTESNNKNAEISTLYKNYIECYKDVLFSQITAISFIYSEFSAIINAHLASYGIKPAVTKTDNAVNNGQKQQPQNKEQQK